MNDFQKHIINSAFELLEDAIRREYKEFSGVPFMTLDYMLDQAEQAKVETGVYED